jgi:hypothetical protein
MEIKNKLGNVAHQRCHIAGLIAQLMIKSIIPPCPEEIERSSYYILQWVFEFIEIWLTLLVGLNASQYVSKEEWGFEIWKKFCFFLSCIQSHSSHLRWIWVSSLVCCLWTWAMHIWSTSVVVFTKRKENFTAKFGFVSNSYKQRGFVQASYTTYLQPK